VLLCEKIIGHVYGNDRLYVLLGLMLLFLAWSFFSSKDVFEGVKITEGSLYTDRPAKQEQEKGES